MQKIRNAAFLLLLLGALTFAACLVDDEVFGLFILLLWAIAGIGKILAAHEEYLTSR